MAAARSRTSSRSTSSSRNGAAAAEIEAKAGDAASSLDPAKQQALKNAVGQIEKAFGTGSIMKLDEDAYLAIPGISTGALSLDLALGGRGIPRGRIVEVFGPESSGKTTLALTVAAHAQKTGGVAAFIDAEHALDPTWAKKLGVNIDELLVSQPDTGEQALEICELLVRSNAVDIIVDRHGKRLHLDHHIEPHPLQCAAFLLEGANLDLDDVIAQGDTVAGGLAAGLCPFAGMGKGKADVIGHWRVHRKRIPLVGYKGYAKAASVRDDTYP